MNTVIFDMDGLLIDSEPLWQKAGMETLEFFGAKITLEQYYNTTGLRTKEWIEYWFDYFNIKSTLSKEAILTIENKAIENIEQNGTAFPGTYYILDFFKEKKFNIGLATSSPVRLINVVIEKLRIQEYFRAFSSAEDLAYGKPHPEVYLNCALELGVSPLQCLCFEDSFNGLISVKAAKMKCVVVPAPVVFDEARWSAADAKIASLADFNDTVLQMIL